LTSIGDAVVHEPEPAGALASLAVGERADERPGEDGSAEILAVLLRDLKFFRQLLLGERRHRRPKSACTRSSSTVPPVALARSRAGVSNRKLV